ncbi:MAG TPA: GntR family transcriptional regulator [Ruminococcaceae bacterium]|nr:GntR family transcriptional regulator [Oscillospiraceae bacterium]
MAWELKSDRPIYAQLVERIELMVVSGLYPPGCKLPSVRDLAAEAAVNPNTMQRAMSQLERSGLIFSQRTSGRFVTEDKEKIEEIKKSYAKEISDEYLRRMYKLGFTSTQIAAFLDRMIEESEQNG